MATPVFITGLSQGQGGLQFTVGRGFRIRASKPAQLTTALAGANNDLTYTAKALGTAGNAVTVAYVVAGANTPLTIGVAANAITVNVATSAGSAATSTATQVLNAIRASAPANALVGVALAAGNDGTGVVTALGATNLAGGTNPSATERGETLILANTLYQVDVDLDEVRKRLARNRTRWVEVPTGSLTNVPIRSLLTPSAADVGQSFISRGMRIPLTLPGSTGTQTSVNLTTASGSIEVDTTKPNVRKALRQHQGKWTVAAPTALSSSLITIRGLVTTSSAPGGGVTAGRGFRINKWGQAGGGAGQSNVANITSTTNTQVDLADFNVRRALRRNIGRWIVVSAP